jgi:hypothetical protein
VPKGQIDRNPLGHENGPLLSHAGLERSEGRYLIPNPLILLAPRAGLEPATKRLTAARSTN